MSFLPKYLTVAAIGTLAVYAGAPYLRLYLPNSQPALDAEESADELVWAPMDEEGAPSARHPSRSTADEDMRSRRAVEKVAQRNAEASERAHDDTVGPSPIETDASKADETPEVIVENVRGYTPSTERIRASGSDVTYWGVTIVDASFYDRDGKLRDTKIMGGTLIEQTGAKSSSKGEMAICRIWRNGNWAGSYLISTADLIRFDGGREEVDADDVDNLCRYYGLSAAVERRKEELVQKAASANPHYRELKAKAKAYNDHMKRAEELTAKRDQAKGAERSRIIAELTQLKNAEAREAAEVQSLTRKYEEWKKNHPSTSGADPSSDPVCKGYLRQMDELRPKLTVFGL